jgi:endonuclease/exonuclease/phosphatase (EEP) superfamily protein YafD
LTELKQKLEILTVQTRSAKERQEKLKSEISNSQQDIQTRTEGKNFHTHTATGETQLRNLEIPARYSDSNKVRILAVQT